MKDRYFARDIYPLHWVFATARRSRHPRLLWARQKEAAPGSAPVGTWDHLSVVRCSRLQLYMFQCHPLQQSGSSVRAARAPCEERAECQTLTYLSEFNKHKQFSARRTASIRSLLSSWWHLISLTVQKHLSYRELPISICWLCWESYEVLYWQSPSSLAGRNQLYVS